MAPWFGPKRYGCGARPVSWQGWLLTGLYLVAVLALTKYLKDSELALYSLLGLLTFLYLLVVVRSAPGCRWRWGDKE